MTTMAATAQEAMFSTNAAPFPPVRILVVDDRPENLVAIRATLAASDYRIVEASSGEEALKKLLQEKDFALVLLDVRMPGMDGFEVANLMRHRERTRSVPIVFLTAEAIDIQSAYRGYAAGAVDYLTKPLDPVVLRAKVAALAELHQQREQLRRQGELLLEAETQRHRLQVAELELEAQRREKAGLEEAVRMRDEFLALASHELNTPLAPLLTSIQHLLRSARNGTCQPGGAVRALEVALKQIQKLARLVAELLDVTRLESGRVVLSLADVDLAEIARDVAETYQPEAARAGTSLHVSASTAAPGHWDRLRLEQVVTNLVTNAIKFGNRRPIEVSVETNGASAHLVVRDHGIGIPAEQVSHIFDRFGRAESAKHFSGLGLGLYIVRNLVEAHGGTIRVESVPDEGSTFTVELPTSGPTVSVAGAAAPAPPSSTLS